MIYYYNSFIQMLHFIGLKSYSYPPKSPPQKYIFLQPFAKILPRFSKFDHEPKYRPSYDLNRDSNTLCFARWIDPPLRLLSLLLTPRIDFLVFVEYKTCSSPASLKDGPEYPAADGALQKVFPAENGQNGVHGQVADGSLLGEITSII